MFSSGSIVAHNFAALLRLQSLDDVLQASQLEVFLFERGSAFLALLYLLLLLLLLGNINIGSLLSSEGGHWDFDNALLGGCGFFLILLL